MTDTAKNPTSHSVNQLNEKPRMNGAFLWQLTVALGGYRCSKNTKKEIHVSCKKHIIKVYIKERHYKYIP